VRGLTRTLVPGIDDFFFQTSSWFPHGVAKELEFLDIIDSIRPRLLSVSAVFNNHLLVRMRIHDTLNSAKVTEKDSDKD